MGSRCGGCDGSFANTRFIMSLMTRVSISSFQCTNPKRRSMEDTVPYLIDWLTIGDTVRLHEALCDRDMNLTVEMRHVVRARLGLTRIRSHSSTTLSRMLSSYMSESRTRCRECGTACRRKSLVCFRCAFDIRSYRCMVTRSDLRTTPDGWRIKERRLIKGLENVRIVALTNTGAFLYWRREALAALSM